MELTRKSYHHIFKGLNLSIFEIMVNIAKLGIQVKIQIKLLTPHKYSVLQSKTVSHLSPTLGFSQIICCYSEMCKEENNRQ